MRRFYLKYPIQQTASAKLSWSHDCELVAISDDSARSFYEKETSCICDKRIPYLQRTWPVTRTPSAQLPPLPTSAPENPRRPLMARLQPCSRVTILDDSHISILNGHHFAIGSGTKTMYLIQQQKRGLFFVIASLKGRQARTFPPLRSSGKKTPPDLRCTHAQTCTEPIGD